MRTAYINCTLFDGTDDAVTQENMTIVVDDDRIESVCAGAPDTAGAVDATVDLEGAFVMPGMINAHAHHFGTGKPSSTLTGGGSQKAILAFSKTAAGHAYLEKIMKGCLTSALLSGVTTERGVGDLQYVDVKVRNKINQGKFLGPRFLVSGAAITVADGHGAGTFAQVAETPEEFEALVDDRAAHDVDFIKICTTGGVMDSDKEGEAGLLRMNLEQAKAACDAAHKHGLYVASHTEGTEGLLVDLKAGVKTVEHGVPLDDETLALYKKTGAAEICTVSVALPMAKLPCEQTKMPPVTTYNANVVFERIVHGAQNCIEAGIPVGLGTDAACPYITHYDLWREVVVFHTIVGVSPEMALRTVTLGNARILGIDHITGSIEPGKAADFIVLRQNPLEDLHRLRNVEQVIVRGHRIHDAAEQLAPMRQTDLDEVLDTLY